MTLPQVVIIIVVVVVVVVVVLPNLGYDPPPSTRQMEPR